MGLMAQFVDELIVMRDGRIIEHGPVGRVFKAPAHAYTRNLIESVPTLGARQPVGAPPAPPATRSSAPLLQLEAVEKTFTRGTLGRARTVALRPLSLTFDGSVPLVVAVVGQSGSGKSTLAQLVLGLLPPTAGRVTFDGADVSRLGRGGLRSFRRAVQAVFQDPYASYNPFYRVEHALKVTLRNLGTRADRTRRRQLMDEACRGVGLDPLRTLGRHAHQLSGGQRQRLMVGRATMLAPRLLVADEPVSMVDASLRSTILGALGARKSGIGTSILYITHDLATAYAISDYVLVLHKGRIVEAGDPELVIRDPRHPYTKLLVDSVPWPDPDIVWASGQSIAADLAALKRIPEEAPPIIRSEIAGFRLEASPTSAGSGGS
jgi:peptide/nickel transport system ATP-binding protein